MTFSVEDEQRQGARRRPGPGRAARAGAPDAARRARRRDAQARAHRPDDVDVREDPEGRRAARAPARPCARTCRWSTRARPSGCARWRARRRRRCTCASGTRRLLALTIPSPAAPVPGLKLGNAASLALMEAPHASVQAVLEDAATAAIAGADGPTRAGRCTTRRRFERLRDYVAGHAGGRDGADHRRRRADPAGRARGARASSTSCTARRSTGVRRDVAQQIGRLVFPGFITADRRAAAARRRALPARRRVAARAPDQERGGRPRPHARDPRARGPLPAPAAGAARRAPVDRRARRGAVAARGAADQRSSRRRSARKGQVVGEARSAGSSTRPRLTTNDPLGQRVAAARATSDHARLASSQSRPELETHDRSFPRTRGRCRRWEEIRRSRLRVGNGSVKSPA